MKIRRRMDKEAEKKKKRIKMTKRGKEKKQNGGDEINGRASEYI